MSMSTVNDSVRLVFFKASLFRWNAYQGPAGTELPETVILLSVMIQEYTCGKTGLFYLNTMTVENFVASYLWAFCMSLSDYFCA